MDVRDRVKQFILDDIVGDSQPDIKDFADDESLVDAGILDSLGMLKLIAFLDEEMSTNIMAEEFSLEDFATLNLICDWVGDHGDTAEASATEAAAPAKAELEPTTKMPSVEELRAGALASGLENRVVLITGASRGIGETIAKLFSIYGSRVVVNYSRSADHARRVADEITTAGGQAMVCAADVSDPDQVAHMVAEITERWGTIDVLVNNAANDVTPTDFAKVSWDEIESSINVIVKGAFNCCKAVIPTMLDRGMGKVINIGSLATDNPAPNQLKYVIAKSALVGLTRSLAVDYANRNIQVNLVSPSVVATDLISHIPDAYREKIAQDTPMKRNATPQDVAQAVVYLASNHSGFMTGQKIMVTGGSAPFF